MTTKTVGYLCGKLVSPRATIRALTILFATFWLPLAAAHDPKLHGFDLVEFKKPFTAPAIELLDLDGEARSLADYRGRYVLLNFWATWCPPCLKEMPSMQALADRYDDDKFTVIAVSSDAEGRSIVAPFIEKLAVEFPIWLDADGAVSAAYGAKNLPVSFLIDPEGQVVAAATGERDWSSDSAYSTFDELLNSTN